MEFTFVAFHLLLNLVGTRAKADDAEMDGCCSEGKIDELEQVSLPLKFERDDGKDEEGKDAEVEGEDEGQAGSAGQARLVERDAAIKGEEEIDEQSAETKAATSCTRSTRRLEPWTMRRARTPARRVP